MKVNFCWNRHGTHGMRAEEESSAEGTERPEKHKELGAAKLRAARAAGAQDLLREAAGSKPRLEAPSECSGRGLGGASVYDGSPSARCCSPTCLQMVPPSGLPAPGTPGQCGTRARSCGRVPNPGSPVTPTLNQRQRRAAAQLAAESGATT